MRTTEGETESFYNTTGLHQGSVLSPCELVSDELTMQIHGLILVVNVIG